MNRLINSFKYLLKRIIFWIVVNFMLPAKKEKPGEDLGLSMLLCHRDIDLSIFSITSFFYFLGRNLPLYIINDGTLTQDDIAKINRHFFANIISPERSDKKVAKIIKNYPSLEKIRFDNKTAVYKYKLDLMLLPKFKRNIIMDPDVLFQKTPDQVVNWINKNSDNIAYTVHDDTFFKMGYFPEFGFRVFMSKYLNTKMSGGFSSGFLLLPKIGSEFLRKMNDVSKFLEEVYWTKSDNIDEVILSGAISLTRGSIELPKNLYYIMALNEQYDKKKEEKAVMIHYGHVTTFRYYSTVIRILRSTNFFSAPSF